MNWMDLLRMSSSNLRKDEEEEFLYELDRPSEDEQ